MPFKNSEAIIYEYKHGGNIYAENGTFDSRIIDFSANINPLGIPENIPEAVSRSVSRSNIYPDSYCRALTLKTAEFENTDSSKIFFSNGASDILFRLTFALKPERILVTAPSFSDYERAGQAAGAEIIYYALKKETDFNIEKDITDSILSFSPDIVFICNPNNPTGNLTGVKMLAHIAATCKKVNSLLVADECFLDFTEDSDNYSAKQLFNTYGNILVLKAFTKIFAIPGLRLGYAICADESLINRMRFHGADWAVSTTAQAAGIAALENGSEFIKDTVSYVSAERERLINALADIGMTVYPAQANFIFFHCPLNIDLHGILRKQGVIIRDCANYKGLVPGYYRTAVLTREKNNILIDVLRGVKESWQKR